MSPTKPDELVDMGPPFCSLQRIEVERSADAVISIQHHKSVRPALFMHAKDNDRDPLFPRPCRMNLLERHNADRPFRQCSVLLTFQQQRDAAVQNVCNLLTRVKMLWQGDIGRNGDMTDNDFQPLGTFQRMFRQIRNDRFVYVEFVLLV